MPNEDNIDIVQRLVDKLAAKAIHIRWPSSESHSSSSPRKSKRRGAGFQYGGFKVFDPADGDDSRHIDHNLSASEADEDTYIVRTFLRPRLVRLHVLLDVNVSMNAGTKGTFKSLLGALCAGCGIMSAKKVKDLASFITYAGQPMTILKTRIASRLLMPALVHAVEDRDLDGLTPDGFDGGGLALALRTTLQKNRSVMLLVSDFVNMNEDDWEALRVAGIQNDTIAVFVQDRRERELPQVPFPGMHYSLEDFRGQTLSFWLAPESVPRWLLQGFKKIFGSVTTAKEFSDNFSRHEARILERLHDCGVHTLVVSTDEEDEAVEKLLALLANKLR